MLVQKNSISDDDPQKASKRWFLIVGVILVSANLRAPLTSIGPLIEFIRDSLAISNAVAGILTTLPLLAFAFLSPFAPKLARRFGMESVFFVALCLLAVGIGLRSIHGILPLLTGTLLLGLSISVCNVLLPSFIKREFSNRLGLMTGVYSVSMNLTGAVASGFSVPLAIGLGLGWQATLGCWAILTILTIVVWVPQIRKNRQGIIGSKTLIVEKEKEVRLWRSALAWQVTLFMGSQSAIFYSTITWLPSILLEKGLDTHESGWMLSIMLFAVLPFTFLVPVIAGRLSNQRLLVTVISLFLICGNLGLYFVNYKALIPFWVILLGIAFGSAFSLSMMFFSLRTVSIHEAGELSGMAQSFGYLLAAVGPTLIGLLHDRYGSWDLPFFLLIGMSFFLLFVGLGAGSARYVNKT